MQEKNLPALVRTGRELSPVFRKLSVQITDIIQTTNDPILREILTTIRQLSSKIALFFESIVQLISNPPGNRGDDFAARYFTRHFSIISENARASKAIISYVLSRLEWLNQHANRIIEALKSLYAVLLTQQIDCEELYRKIYGGDLNLGFDLKAEAHAEGMQHMGIDQAFHQLGLERGVSREEVKAAFRTLAKELHPDVNSKAKEEDFILLQEAYKKILSVMPQEE